MIRIAFLATALLLAVAGPAGASVDAAASHHGVQGLSVAAETPAAGYVVVLRSGEVEPTTARLEASLGFTASDSYSAALKGFAAVLTPDQVARLRLDRSVSRIVPDVPFRAAGKKVPAAAPEAIPVGVRRIGAVDSRHGLGPASPAVAVLDTGLDLENTDLNAAPGVNCITPSRAPEDDNGHGTHVGGTIAARLGGEGVVGVAPGTRLYSVKVLDRKANGRLSTLLCGMDWVHANAARLGIRVANLSLSAAGTDDGACGSISGDALHAAVCSSTRAGIVYVAAAGNSTTNLSATVPASYDETLAVTAMTDTDGRPGGEGDPPCVSDESDDRSGSYSNFAAADLDHTLSAPGTCVVSTADGGGTATMLGTSMAAPHVAAVAALCIGRPSQAGPCAGLRAGSVIDRLRADAAEAGVAHGFDGDPFSPLSGRGMGHLVYAAGY